MEKRLILFLELVRGCSNKLCPSWGTVCKYDGIKAMSYNTLSKSISSVKEVLDAENPFTRVDIWMYGCGDSLAHPQIEQMLYEAKAGLGKYGKLSMAIDSRVEPPDGEWYKQLDKIKIIHKLPENFDWIRTVEYWSEVPIEMSHKLITNKITNKMWETWQTNNLIHELKAVPWHTIQLGTDSPVFTPRPSFEIEEGVPVSKEPYPGVPVRRAMISWDGSLRRCLVSPTKYRTISDLFLKSDDICPTCFPLTGSELAKFHRDRLAVTPSASCVSDGYFQPFE